MVSVVLSVGSNCGDRRRNVEAAVNWLKTILIQTRCSDLYETPCVNGGGSSYINAVISGFYQSQGYTLEGALKEKEREMGRTSVCREKGEVPIDIDIVIMDGEVRKPWDYRQKFFQIGFREVTN